MRTRISFRHFDRLLFLTPVFIFIIGILSITSASYRSGQTLTEMLALKQILWMAIGVLAVFLVVRVDYFRLRDWAWPFYFLTLLGLLAVLFMPARLGAHRWIQMGGFNFQPSEFMKLAVIFVLSHMLANSKPEYASGRKILAPVLVVAVPFFLILKEPDLGTGLLLLPVLGAMLYLWGYPAKRLLVCVLLGLAVSPFLVHFLKEYQRARLLVFLNPNLDPLGAGYTIIQSKIAIGSGGLLGKGYRAGSQNYLNFLPERHTDFIFGVVAEEGGFLVSLAMIAMFWFIVYKGYLIANQTPDRFGSLLACGISTMLAVQVIINLGMTMGLLPVVGVPLPLVSYGGSSVLLSMLSIGLLLNIKMHRPLF